MGWDWNKKALPYFNHKTLIIADNYEAYKDTLQEVGHPSSIALRPNPS